MERERKVFTAFVVTLLVALTVMSVGRLQKNQKDWMCEEYTKKISAIDKCIDSPACNVTMDDFYKYEKAEDYVKRYCNE